MEVEKNLKEIFDLYDKFGDGDYLGEPVTKTVHSLQCAILAEQEEADDATVLGAFFHDIGHLLGERDGYKAMVFEGINLGAKNHAALGAEYLRSKGFDEDVTDVVRAHVMAKRYLCWKNPEYYDNLSWASKRTLEFQGGPMNEAEGLQFQANPRFDVFIKMRHWDEMAKDDKWMNLKPTSYFHEMAKIYLLNKTMKT